MNRVLTKEFLEELSKDLEKQIEENCLLERLQNYKNILIIQSVKSSYFHTFVEKLESTCKNSQLYFVCEADNVDFLLQKQNVQFHVISHKGKYDEEEADDFYRKNLSCEQIGARIDAICFLNYEVFRLNHRNVDAFCKKIMQQSSADLFSYQVGKESLTFYKDMERFQKGLELVYALMKYLDAIPEAEYDHS